MSNTSEHMEQLPTGRLVWKMTMRYSSVLAAGWRFQRHIQLRSWFQRLSQYDSLNVVKWIPAHLRKYRLVDGKEKAVVRQPF